MSCKVTFESIIKFCDYDLLLKLDTSSINCRILFPFKPFLFYNFMLYRAENTSVFVESCNFKI